MDKRILSIVAVVGALVFILVSVFVMTTGEKTSLPQNDVEKQTRKTTEPKNGRAIPQGDPLPLPDDPVLREAAERSDRAQDYSDRLAGVSDMGELMRRWPEVVAAGDPDELPAFIVVFASKLRESGDVGTYRQLSDILKDPASTTSMRTATLTVLGRSATPEAMRILTGYLLDGTPKDDDVRRSVTDNIHEATVFLDGEPNWAVSPVLEDVWRTHRSALSEKDRLRIAQEIAYLSTASGASALLETFHLSKDGNMSGSERTFVLMAISSLSRNEVIPVLQSELRGQPDGEMKTAIVTAFMNIDSADAALALVEHFSFAGNMGDTQERMLRAQVSDRVFSDEFVKVIRDALKEREFSVQERGLLEGMKQAS